MSIFSAAEKILNGWIWLSDLYTGCIKTGNRTLECYIASVIQSTEIIRPQSERHYKLSIDAIFVNTNQIKITAT